MCEKVSLPEKLTIPKSKYASRSFAEANAEATNGIKEKVSVAIPILKINPIKGMTARFANNAMIDNLPKYNSVNGNVPI